MANRDGEMQEGLASSVWQCTRECSEQVNSEAVSEDDGPDFIETAALDSKALESDNVGGSSVRNRRRAAAGRSRSGSCSGCRRQWPHP